MAAQEKKFNTEARMEAIPVRLPGLPTAILMCFFRGKYVQGMKSRLCFFYSIIVVTTSKGETF